MKITCLIVDDEKLARDFLTELLEEFPQVEIIGQCANGQEAVQKINDLEPQLIFLDVQMPGMDGFEVLEKIESSPYVIFCTAYDQYAIKAFDQNAIDYLLKPLDLERFKLAVGRAIKRVEADETNLESLIASLKKDDSPSYSSHLFVQKSEKLLNLSVKDIVHLEASGDYTVLTTKMDQYVSSSGIGKLEEILDPEIFIRIHRSTIININCLKEIEKHFNGGLVVRMENGKTFPVSRTYARKIREKIV
jgi:two-component system, LytTR family, response regulator